MTLVERFIEITDWPDSRKIALLSGLVLPFYSLSCWFYPFVATQVGFVDPGIVYQYLLAHCGLLLLTLVVSLLHVLTGWSARWVLYVFGAAQTLMMFWPVHIYGSASTTFIVIPFVSVLLFAIFFSVSLAWVLFLLSALFMATLSYLEATGQLAYAPALMNRSLDVQNHPWWLAANIYTVLIATFLCLFFGGLAIGARHLQEQRLKRAQALIRRYVPPALAAQIIEDGSEGIEAPQRRRVTVLFSDIAGFTILADRVEPEVMTEVMSEYISAMVEAVDAHGGTVNEFAGDGLMALYGAPKAMLPEEQALAAVRTALAMQAKLPALNAGWRKLGLGTELRVRIGINTGMVSVGSYGAQGRMTYTAMGIQTNIAARIQSQCEPGNVLISDATWQLVREQIECIPRGEIECKGVHYPVAVYEPKAP